MVISDENFINKCWLQKNGDSLLVLEKFPPKDGKKSQWRGIFQNHPYEIFADKQTILKGYVGNPQIEIDEFINKLWPQHCGDTLRILKKSDKKENTIKKYPEYLWECQFIGYSDVIYATKTHIKEGCVANYEKEKIELTSKLWPQSYGEELQVIEKTDIKKDSRFLWRCKFTKYPYEILVNPNEIRGGFLVNPQIEKTEFMDKLWLQNCGDTLRILNKEKKEGVWYFNCEFINYPKYYNKVKVLKSNILNRTVVNHNLPWKNKDNFVKFIKENFEDKKPSLKELSEKLKENFPKANANFPLVTVGSLINQWELKDYIEYAFEGSYIEKELRDYIQSLILSEKISNTWKELGNNQEIDIYISSRKLGIEFNGNYYHSNLFKDQKYHQEKTLQAKSKGIFLIHVFEYEWLDRQDIIKSLIKSKLGLFRNIIGARKCCIKELDYRTYADFCNENHLQGEAGAVVKIGLFYKEELVQIMSFSKPRFTDKYEWEIIRECSKLDYSILGGKEKLWNYFLNKYAPNSVISYCDYSKFNGNSYLKLGFSKQNLNKPGFVWYDDRKNKIFWRNPYKHQEIKEKGYNKIFDCGQLVFTWLK